MFLVNGFNAVANFITHVIITIFTWILDLVGLLILGIIKLFQAMGHGLSAGGVHFPSWLAIIIFILLMLAIVGLLIYLVFGMPLQTIGGLLALWVIGTILKLLVTKGFAIVHFVVVVALLAVIAYVAFMAMTFIVTRFTRKHSTGSAKADSPKEQPK